MLEGCLPLHMYVQQHPWRTYNCEQARGVMQRRCILHRLRHASVRNAADNLMGLRSRQSKAIPQVNMGPGHEASGCQAICGFKQDAAGSAIGTSAGLSWLCIWHQHLKAAWMRPSADMCVSHVCTLDYTKVPTR